MQGPLVTSVDAVRWAIADQIRNLGGNEQAVDDVAIAAAHAMSCRPRRPGIPRAASISCRPADPPFTLRLRRA